MKESKSKNNQYEIKREWFRSRKAHDYKFPKAFDYLQQSKHDRCLVLTDGDCIISDVKWSDAVVGLLADFEARLSIFYSDFIPKGNNNIDIAKIPNVDKNMLENAIIAMHIQTKLTLDRKIG